MGRAKPHPLRAEAWWLLLISGIFSLAVGLSNTFVNVYLWKVDKSYIPIGWYNFATYCAMPLAFIMAAWLANRRRPTLTLRIGFLLHALFYLIAVAGGPFLAAFPFVLGLILGLAAGFYWYSFNFISLRVTNGKTRDRFYGWNGAGVAVAGMIAPTAAGYLISIEDRFGGLTGYHVVFGISLALFLVGVGVSFRLRLEHTGGSLNLFGGLKYVRHRRWHSVLLGCFVYGWREGVFIFLIGLLVYIGTGSELRLGGFLLLQNALSFLSFSVVGRLVRPATRVRVLGIGAGCLAAAALLFLLPITGRLVIWYGSIAALALPLFLVPLQGLVFSSISDLDESGEQHDEQIVFREVAENAGRVAGIGVFLVVVSNTTNVRAVAWFAVCLGFVQLITWLVIYWGSRTSQRDEAGTERLLYRSRSKSGI